ncbi:hypothetical protein BH09VER1_BH09VER1_51020 [soil metagenome]
MKSADPSAAGAVKRWSYRQVQGRLVWWPAVSLLLLWQLLYLPHLRDAPSWYGDETATLLLSRNLFHGEPAMGSYWMTYWHCYLPYFPGYLWPTGLFAYLTGDDILGGRFFNVLLALGIAQILYFLGRARFGCGPAWFGAALFLTYEQSLIHFRWIYPHNAVALGFAVATLFLLRPSRPATNWGAGVGLAIGALAHPLFAHGAIAAVLCRLKRPGAWLRMAILPAVVMLVTVLALVIAYWPKTWFFEDFGTLVEYYRKSGGENQGSKVLANFWDFYSSDLFLAGGLTGAVLCLRRRFYPVAIVFGVVSLLLLKNRGNLYSFYYQANVLTPVLAMCWMGGVATVRWWVRKWAGRPVARGWLGAMFLLPLGYGMSDLPGVLKGELMTRNQYLVTQSIPEVEVAAEWLNARTKPNDLVIVNHNLAWLLHCRTADLIQAALWQGWPTVYFEHGLKRERFRYPADFEEARYLVVGDVDERWTLKQLNISEITERLSQENWPVVWRGRYYTVYANPRFTTIRSGL